MMSGAQLPRLASCPQRERLEDRRIHRHTKEILNNHRRRVIARRPQAAPPQKKTGPRINQDIRAENVLLIDENGEKQGTMPIGAALDAAKEAGLDLVEVSPDQEVPVCKIIDYGKLKFEDQKKKAAARKKQKSADLKEIKMRPKIDFLNRS